MKIPKAMRIPRGQVGAGIVLVVLFVAFVGPTLAPHSVADIVGEPGAKPSGTFWLGTDFLGRDVFSRLLFGGQSVVLLSLAATVLAFLIGATVGLIAGYSRSVVDPILMRLVDVVLSFPPLLFFLIVAASLGQNETVLIIGVAIVEAPGVARIMYSLARDASVRAYVEAAVARGERTASILRREILPNIVGPVIANFGLTLTLSILLVAAVNFLGLGAQPPAANWALMISENRPIVPLNVWATVAPAAMIALLTVGVNLLGDVISQTYGRSDLQIARRIARDAVELGEAVE